MCLTKFGLVNNDIRKKVWPLILNLHSLENAAKKPDGTISKNLVAISERLATSVDWVSLAKKPHKEYNQVNVDVLRSLNTFDVCRRWSQTMKDVKRAQLRRVIMAILNRNPNLCYYQGFHDFVSVFLLTLDENLAFYCANTATNYLISDFLLEGFE